MESQTKMETKVESQTKSSVVLYAEDEENDVLFMQIAFDKAGLGHLLRVVQNGQEVVDYLSGAGAFADRHRHPLPSLLLLDLNMPLLSGFGVLQWLRNQPAFHDLPVVVFSSSTLPEDKLKAANLGVSEFVPKPASGAKFTEVVTDLRGHWPGLIGKAPV